MTTERKIAPRVGGAVVVSHFDRHHKVHTVVAHVLAISGGIHLLTPDGAPALTVAFPDPAADPTVLQGPNFARAYRREVGVVHHSHPEAQAGRHSIVWGHALDQEELNEEALLEGPKHSAVNSAYERHQPEANLAEIQQGLHGSPALRSELEPSAADLDAVAAEETAKQKTMIEDTRTPLERAAGVMRANREPAAE